MRLLCGQCGHVNKLDDGYSQPTAACERCGYQIPVAAFRTEPAAEVPSQGPPGEVAPAAAGAAEAPPEEMGFAEQARQSNGRKMTVTCSQCGKTVTVSARVAGKNARCKGCNQPIIIPYPDDLEDFELPKLPRAGADRVEGLDLVAPLREEESGHAAPEPIALEEPVPQDELELSPQQAVGPDGQPIEPQPEVYDPVAALAAIDRAAPLIALEQAYNPQEPVPAPALEPPAQAGELVSAIQDFHEDRQAAKAKARQREQKATGRRRTLRWVFLALLACAILAVPLGVLVAVFLPGEPPGNHGAPVIGEGGGPKEPNRIVQAIVHPTTRTRPEPRPETQTQPGPKKPTCEVVAAAARAFAAEGYFPAPPKSIYWRITAKITAGEEAIRFETHGRDVRLVFGQERYDSLGEPGDGGGLLPARSRKTTVSLKPLEGRAVSFLFEVPQHLRKGGLLIGRVGYVDLTLPDIQAGLSTERLAGTYVEAPPRNLQPLLRDPVMAAIQGAPQQQLVVAPGGAGIDLAIPAAGVRGTAKSVLPGLFEASLQRGGQTLAAQVRFVEEGRRAILYLSDRPFHQLTYVNPDFKPPPPPPKPAPVTPAPAIGTTASGGRTTGGMGIMGDGPGIQKSPSWDSQVPFDPNTRPRRTDRGELPTGPSIFD